MVTGLSAVAERVTLKEKVVVVPAVPSLLARSKIVTLHSDFRSCRWFLSPQPLPGFVTVGVVVEVDVLVLVDVLVEVVEDVTVEVLVVVGVVVDDVTVEVLVEVDVVVVVVEVDVEQYWYCDGVVQYWYPYAAEVGRPLALEYPMVASAASASATSKAASGGLRVIHRKGYVAAAGRERLSYGCEARSRGGGAAARARERDPMGGV